MQIIQLKNSQGIYKNKIGKQYLANSSWSFLPQDGADGKASVNVILNHEEVNFLISSPKQTDSQTS
jgi:hypothetical protein